MKAPFDDAQDKQQATPLQRSVCPILRRAFQQIAIVIEAGWRIELFVRELETQLVENFSGIVIFRMMTGE